MPENESGKNPVIERIEVASEQIGEELQKLVKKGGVSKISIKDSEGEEAFKINLLAGAGGVSVLALMYAPAAAAMLLAGVVATFIGKATGLFTIEIERIGEPAEAEEPAEEPES